VAKKRAQHCDERTDRQPEDRSALTLKYSERSEVVKVMTRAPTCREAHLAAISRINSSGKQVELAKTRSASAQEEQSGSIRNEPWTRCMVGGVRSSGHRVRRN
jgi:hypothetical protein